jgi:hypothetical protein
MNAHQQRATINLEFEVSKMPRLAVCAHRGSLRDFQVKSRKRRDNNGGLIDISWSLAAVLYCTVVSPVAMRSWPPACARLNFTPVAEVLLLATSSGIVELGGEVGSQLFVGIVEGIEGYGG